MNEGVLFYLFIFLQLSLHLSMFQRILPFLQDWLPPYHNRSHRLSARAHHAPNLAQSRGCLTDKTARQWSPSEIWSTWRKSTRLLIGWRVYFLPTGSRSKVRGGFWFLLALPSTLTPSFFKRKREYDVRKMFPKKKIDERKVNDNISDLEPEIHSSSQINGL